jgi:hypothetical protein
VCVCVRGRGSGDKERAIERSGSCAVEVGVGLVVGIEGSVESDESRGRCGGRRPRRTWAVLWGRIVPVVG